MVADEQTHTLPGDRAALERFARFLGFADRDAFAKPFCPHLHNVQRHYAAPVRDRPRRPKQSEPSLEFSCARPTTAKRSTSLPRMGFRTPLEVSTLVRGWLAGELPLATERVRAQSACRTGAAAVRAIWPFGNPDAALHRVRSLPRQTAGRRRGFFPLLRQNPDLVALIALVLGTAPRLADILAQHPASDGCADRAELSSARCRTDTSWPQSSTAALRRPTATRTFSIASAFSARSTCS